MRRSERVRVTERGSRHDGQPSRIWKPITSFIILLFCIHSSESSPINRQVGISENVFITVQNDTYGNEQRVCSIDSVTYEDGDSIPTSSPCEHCICRPPGFACTIISCEYRPGCKALKRSNQCCPEYQCECEKDGKIYQNGEKILDNNNPCEVCYCQGGDVICAVIDCYWRSDCQPRYIENRCCPLYDHCPPPQRPGPIRPIMEITTSTTALPTTAAWFNLTSTTLLASSSIPSVPLEETTPKIVAITTTTTATTSTEKEPVSVQDSSVPSLEPVEQASDHQSTTASVIPTSVVPSEPPVNENIVSSTEAPVQAIQPSEEPNDRVGANQVAGSPVPVVTSESPVPSTENLLSSSTVLPVNIIPGSQSEEPVQASVATPALDAPTAAAEETGAQSNELANVQPSQTESVPSILSSPVISNVDADINASPVQILPPVQETQIPDSSQAVEPLPVSLLPPSSVEPSVTSSSFEEVKHDQPTELLASVTVTSTEATPSSVAIEPSVTQVSSSPTLSSTESVISSDAGSQQADVNVQEISQPASDSEQGPTSEQSVDVATSINDEIAVTVSEAPQEVSTQSTSERESSSTTTTTETTSPVPAPSLDSQPPLNPEVENQNEITVNDNVQPVEVPAKPATELLPPPIVHDGIIIDPENVNNALPSILSQTKPVEEVKDSSPEPAVSNIPAQVSQDIPVEEKEVPTDAPIADPASNIVPTEQQADSVDTGSMVISPSVAPVAQTEIPLQDEVTEIPALPVVEEKKPSEQADSVTGVTEMSAVPSEVVSDDKPTEQSDTVVPAVTEIPAVPLEVGSNDSPVDQQDSATGVTEIPAVPLDVASDSPAQQLDAVVGVTDKTIVSDDVAVTEHAVSANDHPSMGEVVAEDDPSGSVTGQTMSPEFDDVTESVKVSENTHNDDVLASVSNDESIGSTQKPSEVLVQSDAVDGESESVTSKQTVSAVENESFSDDVPVTTTRLELINDVLSDEVSPTETAVHDEVSEVQGTQGPIAADEVESTSQKVSELLPPVEEVILADQTDTDGDAATTARVEQNEANSNGVNANNDDSSHVINSNVESGKPSVIVSQQEAEAADEQHEQDKQSASTVSINEEQVITTTAPLVSDDISHDVLQDNVSQDQTTNNYLSVAHDDSVPVPTQAPAQNDEQEVGTTSRAQEPIAQNVAADQADVTQQPPVNVASSGESSDSKYRLDLTVFNDISKEKTGSHEDSEQLSVASVTESGLPPQNDEVAATTTPSALYSRDEAANDNEIVFENSPAQVAQGVSEVKPELIVKSNEGIATNDAEPTPTTEINQNSVKYLQDGGVSIELTTVATALGEGRKDLESSEQQTEAPLPLSQQVNTAAAGTIASSSGDNGDGELSDSGMGSATEAVLKDEKVEENDQVSATTETTILLRHHHPDHQVIPVDGETTALPQQHILDDEKSEDSLASSPSSVDVTTVRLDDAAQDEEETTIRQQHDFRSGLDAISSEENVLAVKGEASPPPHASSSPADANGPVAGSDETVPPENSTNLDVHTASPVIQAELNDDIATTVLPPSFDEPGTTVNTNVLYVRNEQILSGDVNTNPEIVEDVPAVTTTLPILNDSTDPAGSISTDEDAPVTSAPVQADDVVLETTQATPIVNETSPKSEIKSFVLPSIFKKLDPISDDLAQFRHDLPLQMKTEVNSGDETWYWRTLNRVRRLPVFLKALSQRQPRSLTPDPDAKKTKPTKTKKVIYSALHSNKKRVSPH